MFYKKRSHLLLFASYSFAVLTIISWLWYSIRQSQSLPSFVPQQVRLGPANINVVANPAVEPANVQVVSFNQPSATGQLQVHFIDVGQGDSVFIQAPDGTTALIDGGSDNSLAYQYLLRHGINRIDVLIVSHPHADHMGGLIEIIQNIPVGSVWTSGAVHYTPIFEQFVDAMAEAKIPYREAPQGHSIPLGTLHFDVLHSDAAAAELNDGSLVVKLVYNHVSFLFMGDAESSSEEMMVRDLPAQLDATVLKVGHHGSYTSSTPAFIAAVSPEIAVYSAGMNNPYRHPHQETLDTLRHAQVAVYGTDVYGSVVVSTDGYTYSVLTGQEQFVNLARGGENAAAPSYTYSPTYDPYGRDRNCGSFDTQAEAQQFFVAAGGRQRDSHGLDGDNDGIACEHLP